MARQAGGNTRSCLKCTTGQREQKSGATDVPDNHLRQQLKL